MSWNDFAQRFELHKLVAFIQFFQFILDCIFARAGAQNGADTKEQAGQADDKVGQLEAVEKGQWQIEQAEYCLHETS